MCLPAYVHMGLEEIVESMELELQAIAGCLLVPGCWDKSPSPLISQQALLPAKPVLQPSVMLVIFSILLFLFFIMTSSFILAIRNMHGSTFYALFYCQMLFPLFLRRPRFRSLLLQVLSPATFLLFISVFYVASSRKCQAKDINYMLSDF